PPEPVEEGGILSFGGFTPGGNTPRFCSSTVARPTGATRLVIVKDLPLACWTCPAEANGNTVAKAAATRTIRRMMPPAPYARRGRSYGRSRTPTLTPLPTGGKSRRIRPRHQPIVKPVGRSITDGVESPPVAYAVLLLLGGAAVLTACAEAAIRGAGRLALERGVSPFLLGALLFGVDIESLGAALTATGRGQTSIAVGEAFGTVVFLFCAAFGSALLLARQATEF